MKDKPKKPPSDVQSRIDAFNEMMSLSKDRTSWKANYDAERIKAKNEVGQYNPSTGQRDYPAHFNKSGRIGRRRRMKDV